MEMISLGDPTWDTARTPWNVAVDQQPAMVVTVRDVDDVVAAVRLAAEKGLAVTAQPNGHGATPALNGTMLLRTSPLDEISIDGAARSETVGLSPREATARVGAGVTWGTFLEHLDGTGLIALAGSSPDINVVGYLLGGGLSWFSRKYGPASRSVTAIELVDADGEVHRVTDGDLFWALRGGGGDFGIVTAVEFDLYDEPLLTGGKLMFPGEQAAAVLAAVSELSAVAPRELTLWAGVTHFPPIPDVPEPLRGNTFAVVDVTFLGSEAALTPLLYTIRQAGTAVHDTVGPVPIGRLGDVAAEPVDPMPALDRSLMLRRFDADVIDRLLAMVGKGSGTALTVATVRHLGGAYAEPGRDGVAGPSEESHLLFLLGVAAFPGAGEAIAASAAAVREAIGPDGSERVPYNFLGDRGIATAYTTADLDRLRAVKRRIDPAGRIRGNRPLG